METEIWRSHPDIDRLEVSSFGRVRSVKGCYYKISPISGGYLQICFYMNGKTVHKLVHRLVAQTFIPNPNNLPQINHKDNDITNNNVSNLEWCTASYNNRYREKFGISNTESQGHPVFAINLTTLEVSRFRSHGEAGRVLGFDRVNVINVIRGRRTQTCGYWLTNADKNAADAIKRKLNDIKELKHGH